jgi:PAS domain S-box-containing protein
MEALTGCTRDELIGAPFKNYFTDPERAEAGIKRVLSESKVTDYELTARARDGKETVVSYNATTLHDRDRKLQGVFAAARDVTERKRSTRRCRKRTSNWRAPSRCGGKGQPRQVRFPVQHEPRTAHAAQRDPRLRAAHGIRLAAADTARRRPASARSSRPAGICWN